MTLRALGDVARFVNGAAFKPADWKNEGLPIIRIQNLTGTSKKYNHTTRKVKPDLIINDGDLLVSWSATLDVYRWGGPRSLLNQHIFKVFPNTDVDAEYLFFALKSSLAELSAKTHGSTMKHVVRGDFESTQIPVPPLIKQRRIADLLSRAEGIVRLRREAQRTAAELVPALFMKMFCDSASDRKEWQDVTIGDLICQGPQNGLYKHKSLYGKGTPIVRIDSFYDGTVRDIRSLQRVCIDPAEIDRYGLVEDDIVVNRVNSPEYLGKTALVPKLEEPTVFESNMMRIRLDGSRIAPIFAIQALQTRHVKEQIQASAKHAINQSSINQQDVKALHFPLPPLALQRAFALKLESVRRILDQQALALAAARAAFSSLLHENFPSS